MRNLIFILALLVSVHCFSQQWLSDSNSTIAKVYNLKLKKYDGYPGRYLITGANGIDTISSSGGGLSGLNTNYVPYATSATTLGNSTLYFDGTSKYGIGTTSPTEVLSIVGSWRVSGTATTLATLASSMGGDYVNSSGRGRLLIFGGNTSTRGGFQIRLMTSNAGSAITPFDMDNSGNLTLSVLKSTVTAPTTVGTVNMVVADSNGKLSFQTIPSGSGMTNPMTTQYDLIIAGAGGTPGRLAVGTNGQYLGVRSGVLGYYGLQASDIPDLSSTYQTTTNVTSGTYTPTLTSFTNVSASTTHVCHYTKIGNEVTVIGWIEVTPTSSGVASTQIRVSLPIASNFTLNDDDGSGVATSLEGAGIIYAQSAYDDVLITIPQTTTNSRIVKFSFQYTIK